MQNVTMKNIPPSSLPTFYGKSNEDPNTFLFEFNILCRSYNYLQDAHKLKLFPATLKDSSLRWFMGLGEFTMRTWDDMKNSFLQKYQEHCKPKDYIVPKISIVVYFYKTTQQIYSTLI